MGDRDLHVVVGTGQVGSALVRQLVRTGHTVRAVSQSRPTVLADGADWRGADVTDAEAAAAAAEGASVIYQCLNAPYTKWPDLFPPLQAGVLAAAERTDALLVSLENVYGYGPTNGVPMTEDHSLAATTVKGRTRAAMTDELLVASAAGRVRIAIGRASDFFGAGVTQSTLGQRVFAKAVSGQRVDFIGDPSLLHTYSYVPDIASGLATLGTDERAVGHVWHLPGPETVTTRTVFDIIGEEVGHEITVRPMPDLLLRALGVVSPMMKGLAEMRYQFDEPFVLDTSKYEATFGVARTPLAMALAETISWYRNQSGAR